MNAPPRYTQPSDRQEYARDIESSSNSSGKNKNWQPARTDYGSKTPDNQLQIV